MKPGVATVASSVCSPELSVLAAQDALVGDTFFLTTADHVFDKRLPIALATHGAPAGGLSLAVDRDDVFDLDDATKSRREMG